MLFPCFFYLASARTRGHGKEGEDVSLGSIVGEGSLNAYYCLIMNYTTLPCYKLLESREYSFSKTVHSMH